MQNWDDFHGDVFLMENGDLSTGNERKSTEYEDLSAKRMKAIEDLLWNSNTEIWFDYNHETKKQREHFYPSNLFPLYVGCYPKNTAIDYDAKARNYLLVRTHTSNDIFT